MRIFSIEKLLKPAIIGGAVMGLSACMVPGGYYGDGYVNGASSFNCDPYAPFDDYYACDDGFGYANIGYGGGWYDNFYYPGYGTYIFDRRGTRYGMKRHHRRHWARQRADYGLKDGRYRNGNRNAYRGNRGRDLTPEQRAERREKRQERRAERDRNLTPEQRAVRQDRRAERNRSLTPQQRAERRERRAERRNNNGNGVRNGIRNNRGENVRRGNRRPAVARPARPGRPTGAQERPQRRPVTQARPQQPRPSVTPRPQTRPQTRPTPVTNRVPVARPAPRISPRSKEINRRDVSDE